MQVPKTSFPSPGPVAAPSAPPAKPAEPKRSKFFWLAGLAVVIIVGAVLALRMQRDAAAQSAAAGPAIRTAPVATQSLERTLRITGTTGAERFSLLLAPQLRGSRSGFGRGGPSGSFNSSRSSSSTVSSRATTTATASSSTQSGASGGTGAQGASGMGADGSVSSTAGAQGSSRGTSAMRSATSRVSQPSSTSSSSRRSTGSTAAASATMGAEGLGSTSSGLSGGSGGPPSIGSSGGRGGGGGGGGEFSLVLQDVAKPGTITKKGQPVAEFDRESMLTRLDDYKASVVQSEAGFKKLKADLDIYKKAHDQTILAAKGELEKARLTMKTTPVLSAIESERAKLALEEAEARYKQLLEEVKFVDAGLKADVRSAEIELRQAQIELQRAQLNAGRMEMKAPIDGLVVMQNTFRGTEFDQIKQGDQLFPGQPFMQIVDTSSMVINANANQVDVEKLRIGQRARVRFDAFPGLELPARVHSIGTVAKSSRYRPDFIKEMAVVLKLEKTDPRVIPDLSVSCDIVLETSESALVAPREAVFYDGSAAKKGTESAFVYVQLGDEWERRRVEIGLGNHVAVAIRSGLNPGDVVALEVPPKRVKS